MKILSLSGNIVTKINNYLLICTNADYRDSAVAVSECNLVALRLGSLVVNNKRVYHYNIECTEEDICILKLMVPTLKFSIFDGPAFCQHDT